MKAKQTKTEKCQMEDEWKINKNIIKVSIATFMTESNNEWENISANLYFANILAIW